MPVVGEFHAKYWRARANAPPPPVVGGVGGYPRWQSSVIAGSLFGALAGLGPLWARLRWLVRLAWSLRAIDDEQGAVIARVVASVTSPAWVTAREAVRVCAATPKGHQPDAWIDYSRIIKANTGQAQNVFRHLKAVSALRPLADGAAVMSNPDAHLLIELAYHGFAAMGRPGRRVVRH